MSRREVDQQVIDGDRNQGAEENAMGQAFVGRRTVEGLGFPQRHGHLHRCLGLHPYNNFGHLAGTPAQRYREVTGIDGALVERVIEAHAEFNRPVLFQMENVQIPEHRVIDCQYPFPRSVCRVGDRETKPPGGLGVAGIEVAALKTLPAIAAAGLLQRQFSGPVLEHLQAGCRILAVGIGKGECVGVALPDHKPEADQ